MMVVFIDDHRKTYGVEPICRVLPIAPSTYFRHKAQQADPSRRSARAIQDDVLKAIIRRIWEENHHVYGPRKVWKQMGREGLHEARCRVRRLMRDMGLAGAVRGRAWVTTTQPDPGADRPSDLVDRHFVATRPNQLWVADFTYVATWRGFVYVAFVIDVFARRIVGWRVSSYAGIEPSVGSRGDAYDNALAESVIGLFKTEVIRLKGPWRHLEAVEFATLAWVDWFNMRRLLEPIGYVPPAEYEARYYEQLREPATIEDDSAAGIPEPAPTDDRRAWGIL